MTKRFLDCSASDLASMNKKALLHALESSEGRILVSECNVAVQALLYSVTNAELAASQGADLLLLNLFDVNEPKISGMPPGIPPERLIRELQRLTGRVIGINLEAVDAGVTVENDELWRMTAGRAAIPENAARLAEMGVRFLVLTGNPGNGVSKREINHCLQRIRAAVGDKLVLVAGKMHSSGVVEESGDKILSAEDIDTFVASGADMILLPAPGTVPGMTVEAARNLIRTVHSRGAMAMTAIGTSQEGADIETIRQLALMSKMAGADLHHVGDMGYMGVALPNNILAYSIAIRGIRHTYGRIARSINR